MVFHIPTASALLRRTVPAPFGGAERQVLLLARELARREFAVAIVTLDEPGGLRSHVDGVDIVAQPSGGTRRPVIRTLLFWARMARVLTANPSNVIVQRCANIHAAPIALLARVLRRRFVFASSGVHDFDRSLWKSSHWWLFQLGVRLADQVVVQTVEQVQLCRERFDRQPVLIPSIAEPAQTRRMHPEAFLWIGRVSSHKQPRAYVELARRVPEARFRMIPVPAADHEEGVDVAELERLATHVPNLELCPPQQRHELGELYDSAIAVVSTSVSEGMPNVFLEGWSRGVPALAMAHDPDGVIARERLGGFAAGSPSRLAELARALWTTRHDHPDLARRCRLYVAREHALEDAASRWIKVLELSRG